MRILLMDFAQDMKESENRMPHRSVRGRMPSGKPNPVDVYVGNRVKHRRTALSMSQEQLGMALGVTFQQVQKYERGANRIGASRLWDLSRVLECPVSYFYDDMDEETASNSPRKLGEHFRRAERGPAS